MRDEIKEYVLKLSRKVIESELNKENISLENIPEELEEDKACFVTLTKDGELRGCIGSLEAQNDLCQNIIDNSSKAAFYDPRFSALTKEELDDVKIEISVLSEPIKLEYSDKRDLLEKLEPNKHGVILIKDEFSATFLPQVWEQLPDKEKFLEQLSQKAGLKKDTWQNSEIYVYKVEKFSE
jgi:AmmeMemoRadiSam system protein A